MIIITVIFIIIIFSFMLLPIIFSLSLIFCPAGVPKFWGRAITNHEVLSQMVEEQDLPALEVGRRAVRLLFFLLLFFFSVF